MRRTPAPAAPLASPDYYERLGRLQHGLRDSEKKRLDLERKLYEYSQSDTCRVKLKYVKLKKYLKEIGESEKKAHTRNQKYLKWCEGVQAHIGHFTTNTEKLQELKVAVQAGVNSGIAVSRGMYQPATIFMGRQMSAISSIGDFSTEQKSPQATKNFSIPNPHSCQQTAQSGNVTDSCVVQTTQCLKKPDKIGGETSLQIGEETPVTANVLSEGEKTHCLEIGSNTRHGNLSESKKSAELHSPSQERLSPENRTTDLKCDSSSRSEGSEEEMLTREHIEVKEERAGLPVSPISVSEYCAFENKCSQENHSAWEGFLDCLPHGIPESRRTFRKTQEEPEEESWSSSSDLTVSVSEDDLILKSPELQPSPYDKMEGEDGIKALRLIHSEQERDALLTPPKNCILQSLSSPDSKEEPSTNSPSRESESPPHSDLPRAQLGQRVTTLDEQDSSLKEEVAKPTDVFTVKNEHQRMKATALLKKARTEECEDRSSIHSSESSCSLPSVLSDNGGVKEANLSLWLSSVHTRKQEVSSRCRDESKEESVGTKIPITETKAYQLLKQSTLQDNTHRTEDRFQKAGVSASQLAGLNMGSGTVKTKTTNKIASEENFSSRRGSPLSRHENGRKPTTNLKSKAFWGESDDSNSEIEAALRPRNHNTSTDDFDDFYD
ncbi:centrosomal protein kizuna isoform X3 [Loxodonta africana]|uniref:centrosomal protein kizuna isoform X3 n=1 Tax=Loxodonta africana TaxID=9785 RepID=UPI0030D2AF9C